MKSKTILLAFILGVILFNFVSVYAFELNPFAEKKVFEKTIKDDMSDFIKQDFNSKYGVIRLSKTSFWIETDKVAEYSLIENTEQCLIDCEARGKATLYQDGKLFDDTNFLDRKGVYVDVNSKYLIKRNETYNVEVPIYKEICDDVPSNLTKGELTKSCYNVIDDYKNETRTKEDWVEYKGEVLKAGDYEWKIQGTKKPGQSVDFIPIAKGKSFTDWAWWNSSWDYKREISNLTGNISYMNLSYNAHMQSDFDDLRFINSAEDTELNYTIESKSDSNWVVVRVNNLGASSIYMYYGNSRASTTSNAMATHLNPVSYYYLDESSGTTAYDSSGLNNGTNSGANINQNGRIGKAYLFDGSDNLTTASITSYGTESVSLWFKFNEATIPSNWRIIAIQGSAWDVYQIKWALYLNSSKYIILRDYTFDGTVSETAYLNSNINNGNWYHVVGISNQTHTWLYLNGALVSSSAGGNTGSLINATFKIGSSFGGPYPLGFNGTIDEVGRWNRALTSSEISALYNYNAPSYVLGDEQYVFKVNLNSPVDNYNSTNSLITFNCSGTDETGLTYLNLSVDGNYIYNLTGTGTTNLTLVHSASLSEGTHNWTCTASNGINTTSASARNLFIDSISPQITLNYPTSLIDYGIINTTLQLNITANDIHLDKVWYDYNGTNITLTGAISGIYNVSNITLSEKKNITIYANDTIGNLNATTFNWDYKIFENLRTFNSTSYETAYESYKINLTSNGNLSSVNLLFNGTSYSMTNEGGEIWSYSRNIPSSAIGNNSINFSFIYSGNTIYSSKLSYQIINSAVLSICNATYNVPFINFTFKDESSSSSINATIPTSTFVYWLGSGTVNKTLTYSNNTANNNYTFCFSPTNRNVTIDMILQYQGTDYPQRIYNPTVMSFSNSTYNKTLYLLSVVDGLYVTFQVINTAEQVISGVLINATRTIGSEDVVVGDGTTDSSGTVTFWLNPNFQHIIQAFKSGYKTGTLSVFPTQSSYTIQLGTTTTVTEQDYVKGIKISIKPTANQLNNGTSYNFNMTLNSSYWDVESFGFVLRNSTTGDILGSNSSSSNGGIVSFDLNTGNNTTIIMQYYYVINSTYQNYTRTWTVADLTANTGFGVVTLFNRFKTYLTTGDGIFGLNDFGVAIIIFIIIFGSVGIASWKWSITSPAIITTILFVEVLLFDVVLGLLPNVANVHFISIVAGILAVSMVAKEGIR